MQEPLIQKILNLTKYTFARSPTTKHGYRQRVLGTENFSKHLSEIEGLMKQVTVNDIGLQHSPALFPDKVPRQIYLEEINDSIIENKKVESETRLEAPKKATVTYIGVYENCDISVGIFIVNGNSGLPLHNHPGMHGILKVVHGSLTVSSYDKIPQFDITQQKHIPKALSTRLDLIERGYVVPVTPIVPNASMSASSPPYILSPSADNYHKIYNSSDEPAAFVDILSPPYNHKGSELAMDGDSEVRECEYFKEITFPSNDDTDKNIAWLQMIQTPKDFNCDSEPYQGPRIEF